METKVGLNTCMEEKVRTAKIMETKKVADSFSAILLAFADVDIWGATVATSRNLQHKASASF